jgi:hypothetical protein
VNKHNEMLDETMKAIHEATEQNNYDDLLQMYLSLMAIIENMPEDILSKKKRREICLEFAELAEKTYIKAFKNKNYDVSVLGSFVFELREMAAK